MINVRVDQAFVEELDRAAEKVGTDRSSFMRSALAEAVNVALKKRVVTEPHPPRALQLQPKPLGTVVPPVCQHPKAQLKKLQYATLCGVCGARVR